MVPLGAESDPQGVAYRRKCQHELATTVTWPAMFPSEKSSKLWRCHLAFADMHRNASWASGDNMNVKLVWSTLLISAIFPFAVRAQKSPRVFITETTAARASGNAAIGNAKGSLAFTGGTSPQNVEVMKAFARYCPGVVVTANRDKADYVVELDHDPVNPTTPFVHGNKVAVFDQNEDLVYSNATRILSSAVKGACAAMSAGPHR
jgi:hypothetical protein